MKCDNCSTEDKWLECIGRDFICYKCINKHQGLGLILRTSADSFRYAVKKLKPADYDSMMKISTEQINEFVNLKKFK